MRKNTAGRAVLIREGQMTAILALGKKNNHEWKPIPPQLSFISFSCNKICYCIAVTLTVSCFVYYVALRTVRSILKTKKITCCPRLPTPHLLKKFFGTNHRPPLAYASCFTAQFTITAQQVAAAMNQVSPQLCPNAQGLCQTRFPLQALRLFHFSTAVTSK